MGKEYGLSGKHHLQMEISILLILQVPLPGGKPGKVVLVVKCPGGPGWVGGNTFDSQPYIYDLRDV